jgi:hypothetical protein
MVEIFWIWDEKEKKKNKIYDLNYTHKDIMLMVLQNHIFIWSQQLRDS